eukprot:Hpha_TRINITY_DN15274_c1_g1::TRINITY_DN15274_c1_g1_i1::g.66913::m.66913
MWLAKGGDRGSIESKVRISPLQSSTGKLRTALLFCCISLGLRGSVHMLRLLGIGGERSVRSEVECDTSCFCPAGPHIGISPELSVDQGSRGVTGMTWPSRSPISPAAMNEIFIREAASERDMLSSTQPPATVTYRRRAPDMLPDITLPLANPAWVGAPSRRRLVKWADWERCSGQRVAVFHPNIAIADTTHTTCPCVRRAAVSTPTRNRVTALSTLDTVPSGNTPRTAAHDPTFTCSPSPSLDPTGPSGSPGEDNELTRTRRSSGNGSIIGRAEGMSSRGAVKWMSWSLPASTETDRWDSIGKKPRHLSRACSDAAAAAVAGAPDCISGCRIDHRSISSFGRTTWTITRCPKPRSSVCPNGTVKTPGGNPPILSTTAWVTPVSPPYLRAPSTREAVFTVPPRKS